MAITSIRSSGSTSIISTPSCSSASPSNTINNLDFETQLEHFFGLSPSLSLSSSSPSSSAIPRSQKNTSCHAQRQQRHLDHNQFCGSEETARSVLNEPNTKCISSPNTAASTTTSFLSYSSSASTPEDWATSLIDIDDDTEINQTTPEWENMNMYASSTQDATSVSRNDERAELILSREDIDMDGLVDETGYLWSTTGAVVGGGGEGSNAIAEGFERVFEERREGIGGMERDFVLFDMDGFAETDPSIILMNETTEAIEETSVENMQSMTMMNMNVQEDRPWSPINQSIKKYQSGYAAFAPSPEPSFLDTQFLNLTTKTTISPTQTLLRTSRQTTVGKSKTKKTATTAKSAAASSSLEGENNKWIFVTDGKNVEGGNERTGVRRGQLTEKTRKKARRIREIGACWKCWAQKVPCSEGSPCTTCVKHYFGLAPQMCCRTRLHEYVPVFFPEYLHSHFDKKKVEDLVTDNSYGFTDTVIDVAISAGTFFEPMRFQTHVFRPKTWELLGHQQMVTIEGRPPQIIEKYSAPIGIMGMYRSEVKSQCRKHIEDMISDPNYTTQVTAGDRTAIPATILNIAKKYDAGTKNSSLVHEALSLHAIHYFMGVLLTLTEESKVDVLKHVKEIDAPQGDYLTSRLLNRQIKYAMHLLHRDIYQNVLSELEKSLKCSTRKDSWGTSFGTLLLLCLCIEDLQIAADTFVMSDILRDGLSSAARKESVEACTALEEYPFQQCVQLFHDVYRSRREGKGGARDGGLNPFRDFGSDKQPTFDRRTQEMIHGVYELISTSYNEILELVDRDSMLQAGPQFDLREIKAHNTGRVAAKFLYSFLEAVST